MKKIFLLISFLVFGFGFGQNPTDVDLTYDFKDYVPSFVNIPKYGRPFNVQNDGKIIVVNSIPSYYDNNQSVVGSLVYRLNPDFTLDQTYKKLDYTNVANLVCVSDLQNDNKLLVGGSFSSLNGQNTKKLVRLNLDGSIDPTFNFSSNFAQAVTAIKYQSNGKVFIGQQDSSSSFFLAKLNSNGGYDTSFQTYSTNGAIKDIFVQTDGKVLIFYKNIAALTQNGNKLWIKRLNANGTVDSSFNLSSGFDQNSYDENYKIETQPDGKILVNSNFSDYDGLPNKHGLVRLNANGTVDYSFNIGYTYVRDFKVLPDGKILISNGRVLSMRNADGTIDATFSNSLLENRTDIKRFDLKSNGDLTAEIATKNLLTNNLSVKYIKLDSSGNNISPNHKGTYYAGNKIIKKADDEYIVLGKIEDRGCVDYHYGTKFINQNGELLYQNKKNNYAFDPLSILKEFRNAVVCPDGKILVETAEKLLSTSVQTSYKLIKLNQDFSIDTSFLQQSAADKFVFALQTDGKILLSNGGGIRRILSNGYPDTSFLNFGGPVFAICIQPDNKILIGGGFTTFQQIGGYKGLIRLNPDGTLDTSFVYNHGSGAVNEIALQADGKIVINGLFEYNLQLKRTLIKRVNTNGSIDSAFTPFIGENNFYNIVNISVLSDSSILFIRAENNTIMKLKETGIVDTGFNLGSGFNGLIKSILVNENGSIFVTGDFTKYNGTWCNGSIKLVGGNGYLLSGQNKFDSDYNGCDVNDINYSNLRYIISSGSVNQYITNLSGNYAVTFADGNFTINPTFENPSYFTASPTSISVSFPSQASPVIQDFCITPNGVHPDLEITLLPLTVARPGFQAKYRLVYKNKGNQLQSGTVNFNFNDAVLNFVTATTTVSSQTLNNLNWNFTNLMPLETREITITLNVNSPTATPPVTSGFVLNYTTSVSSTLTDEMPSDNTFTFNQTVVNSFDPNDKTCLEGATIATTKVGDYVHYMIRFENTGTYNAQNITVKDVIDTAKYDINTLLPTSGSHSFITRILEGNRAEFYFENINLPFADATNDGYVAFKIKTKSTLVAGDSFSNSAGIYFDYNYPITTNTATTTITALSSQDFTFNDYFSVYPNPVENNLNISKKEKIEISSITIYNMLGQIVVAIPNAKNIETVDVSSLKSGNYFVKINTDKGNSNTKFIKL